MATKAQKVRLSIFLIAASAVLFVFFVVLVGGRIIKRMDSYHIIYEGISVTGLEPGAAVKYHGVQVGRVVNLSVRDAASIQVDIQVNRGTPIKKDTEAVVAAVGITGLKYVELYGGTSRSENLDIGGAIKAGQSFLDTVTGRAEIILAKLEQVLNNLNVMLGPETTQNIQSSLKAIAGVSTSLDGILTENRDGIASSVAHLDSTLAILQETSRETSSMMAAANDLVRSKEVKGTIANINRISGNVKTVTDSLRVADLQREMETFLQNANQMVIHYDMMGLQARDDILKSLRNLEEALDNLRIATDVIRENPSVLLRGRQTTGDRRE